MRPTDPILYNDLGTYLRAKGQDAEAVAAFERAIEIDPDYERAFYNLGTSHLRNARPAQAARGPCAQ